MKNYHIIAFLSLITLWSIACGGEQEQKVGINTAAEVEQQNSELPAIADVSWKDGMTGKVYHNYLQLRTSLVRSDAEGAQVAAANMTEAFTTERAVIKNTVQNIANSDNLEEQRQYFEQLSKQLEPLFKDVIAEGTIYKQYCPMAFDNEGAFGFSDVPEIRNPFFGDKMLTCGKIVEEIE